MAVAGSWLAVVPDSAAGSVVVSPLLARASRIVAHASGRPWLLAGGRLAAEIMSVRVGRARLAVAGTCSANPDELAFMLRGVRVLEDLDSVASRLSGSHHLAVSLDGTVRVQGTVAQTRRVFHRRFGQVSLAADRADLLAALGQEAVTASEAVAASKARAASEAKVDDAVLALRLMFPIAPHPLADRPMWEGVRSLPGDSYLRLEPDRTAREVRWWRAPDPELPLAEGARELRNRLREAVRARSGTRLSADLSGGLDSTSLCFLAAEHGVELTTLRQVNADPGNDDASWAEYSAACLPAAEHQVIELSSLPGKYAGLDRPADPEEPFAWVRSRADLAALAETAARAGGLHLAGHGGDEILTVPPSHLHDLSRGSTARALRRLRGHRAQWRWRWSAVLAGLADNDGYGTWMARHATQVTGPPPDRSRPSFSWAVPGRMPPWATDDAIDLARTAVREAAEERPEPWARQRSHHEILHFAAICGRATRLAGRLYDAAGTRLEAPFLDDRVIEAALAVDLAERGSPDRYKPVLTAAMRGIAPDRLLERTTKGEFSAEVFAGLRRHRHGLLDAVDGSLLASRGLIRPDVLRAAILAVRPTAEPLWQVDMTLACELWLRAQQTTPAEQREERCPSA